MSSLAQLLFLLCGDVHLYPSHDCVVVLVPYLTHVAICLWRYAQQYFRTEHSSIYHIQQLPCIHTEKKGYCSTVRMKLMKSLSFQCCVPLLRSCPSSSSLELWKCVKKRATKAMMWAQDQLCTLRGRTALRLEVLVVFVNQMLLMMAGDVEPNPGPGNLGSDDLRVVRTAMFPARAKWYDIGLELDMSPATLDAIQSDRRNVADCFRKMLTSWLSSTPSPPTWSDLVQALSSKPVGERRLAEKIREKYTAPAEDRRQRKKEKRTWGKKWEWVRKRKRKWRRGRRMRSIRRRHVGNQLEAARPGKPLQCSTVKADISYLRHKFKLLKTSTRKELEKDGVGVEALLDTLYDLPTANKKQHEKFLVKYEKHFDKCRNIKGVFRKLSTYWNYLNIDILTHVIMTLAGSIYAQLRAYEEKLECFLEHTTLKEYYEVEADKEKKKPPAGFVKIVSKHNWEQPTYLKQVHEFRKEVARKYDLHTCAVILVSMQISSVVITMMVPESVPAMINSTDIEFFKEHHVVHLQLNGPWVYEQTEDEVSPSAVLPLFEGQSQLILQTAALVSVVETTGFVASLTSVTHTVGPYPSGENLGPDDLSAVWKAICPARSKWYNIGRQLQMSSITLDAIRRDRRNAAHCLTEMLQQWLSSTSPPPTWSGLAQALSSEPVGEKKLAEKIGEKYHYQDEGKATGPASESTFKSMAEKQKKRKLEEHLVPRESGKQGQELEESMSKTNGKRPRMENLKQFFVPKESEGQGQELQESTARRERMKRKREQTEPADSEEQQLNESTIWGNGGTRKKKKLEKQLERAESGSSQQLKGTAVSEDGGYEEKKAFEVAKPPKDHSDGFLTPQASPPSLPTSTQFTQPDEDRPQVTSPPEEEYEFVEEPPNNRICPVTWSVMLQPHQTHCCGLHLSAEAATVLQAMKKKCPQCREFGFTTYPDIAFRRSVRELRVYCPHKKGGCEWVGELSNVNYHVESCPKKSSPLETHLVEHSQFTPQSSAQKKEMEEREGNMRELEIKDKKEKARQARKFVLSQETKETNKKTLESKLAKVLEIKGSTFPKPKKHRFFQNYTEEFSKRHASWNRSRKSAIISASKPSQTPHLPQLMCGTMSREYRSFVRNEPLLLAIIGSELPLTVLAGDLLSEGLISHPTYHEITRPLASPLKNKPLLLDALHSKILTNVANFNTFLEILRKTPALEDCCKQLESFPDEDPAPITPVERCALHLKKVYKRGILHPRWPPIEKYITLTIIEENTHHIVPMEDVFKGEDGHTVSRVLLQGGPGSGKSTFAFELCTRWRKGEMFQQFSLVVLLPVHDKHVKNAKSLIDLFSIYFNKNEDQKEIVKAIHNNGGEGVLLILEGFDKLPKTKENKDIQYFLISQLFANIELPNATVLITTRPHASLPLHAYSDENVRVLQIVGFGKKEVEQYIQESELLAEKQSSLTKHLHLNPHIYEIVYNPLNCATLVHLYQTECRGMLPPNTTTQLFNQLVRCLLLGFIQGKDDEVEAIQGEDFPQCLPKSVYHEYLQVCEMAHRGFVSGNTEFFPPKNFRHFDLMQAFVKPFEGTLTFTFLHQSLQEYLTAFWIHTQFSSEEKFKVMQERISKPGHYENVLRFLAGLSETKDLESLAKHAFADRQTLNVTSFYLSSDTQGVQMPFLSWLFENQNSDTCAKVLGEGTIRFCGTHHTTPFDYYVLAYCIANSVCKWEIQVQLPPINWLDNFSKGFQAAKGRSDAIVGLDVGHSSITKEGWEFLFSHSINPLQSLQQLILHNTNPPHTGLKDHLPKLRHLQCLALSKTQVGEGGAVGLMEALPKTEISELHLYSTGIGLPDCQALAPYLSDPHCKLRSLDISYNNLTEESVNELTSALNDNCSLTKLSMSCSTFSSEGFSKLVSRLRVTRKRTPITVLDLQKCTLPQGCVGELCTAIAEDKKSALQSLRLEQIALKYSDVNALARMLQTNCSMIILYLKNCSISAAGFTVLSTSLRENKTLCKLSLSGNKMSQDSVIAVCKEFFSEARFACENILHMPVPPLLCLDSCPDELKTTIIDIASEYLQMYYFFQMAQANHPNNEKIPSVKEFIEVTSSVEQKHELCSEYIHFGDHDPSCGRDKIEEMWPGYIP